MTEPLAEQLDNDVKVESSTTDESKEIESGITDTPANAAADPAETPEEKEKKKGSGVQKRINELTSEKYQYKNKAEELEKRLQELELRTQPKEPVKPKLKDFDSDESYEKALDAFYTSKSEHDLAVKRQRETEQARQIQLQNELAKSAETFLKRVAVEKTNFEGFDEAMANPAFITITKQFTPEIVSLIQSSEKSTALAYELATNLDEAEIIANMSPIQAAHRIAKLESRLEKIKPKTISNAPDPVKNVVSGAFSDKDLSKMSTEDFIKQRNKELNKR